MPRSPRRLGRLGPLALLLGAYACGGSSADPVATVVTSPAASTGGGDWPMYGFDARHWSYAADERKLALQSVPTLAPAWQSEIGIGTSSSFSAPSVAGGRVFVGSSVAAGDNFFGFDAATGAKLWSVDLGRRIGPCGLEGNVGIPSTAAISGSTLVVGGGDGAYFALDTASGRVLWHFDLSFAGESAFAWTSPLIRGDRAYVGISSECDNPSVRGELLSLDLASGAPLATQFFAPNNAIGAGIWNSPGLSEDGNVLYVTSGEDMGDNGPLEQAVVALDPTSLAVLEAKRLGPDNQDLDFASSPIAFHDAQGRKLVGAAHKDGCFYAFEAASFASGPRWSRCVGSIVGVLPGFDPKSGGGTLFIVGTGGASYDGSNATIFALDPASGADRHAPTRVGALGGGFALANGLILANAGAGGLLILDAQTGQALRAILPEGAGATLTGPTVAHGFVYWASGSKLNAWKVP